jgi:glycosyltransferase involved in cell wall biosynthesis
MKVTISILIPTYNFPLGINQILEKLRSTPDSEFEILVFDDSTTNEVSKIIEYFTPIFKSRLYYERNLQPLGAVNNWNSLIKNAKGEFLLLLHHDEFPLSDFFIDDILLMLKNYSRSKDVFVFQCEIISSEVKFSRPHLPRFFRSLVVNHFPSYLFRRNVIGPTSCLLVRRHLYPIFDNRLHWLVDVDAYFRLRQKTYRWFFSEDVTMLSLINHENSITTKLAPNISILRETERLYLVKKYRGAYHWLNYHNHHPIKSLEQIAWILVRFFFILLNFLSSFFLVNKNKGQK